MTIHLFFLFEMLKTISNWYLLVVVELASCKWFLDCMQKKKKNRTTTSLASEWMNDWLTFGLLSLECIVTHISQYHVKSNRTLSYFHQWNEYELDQLFSFNLLNAMFRFFSIICLTLKIKIRLKCISFHTNDLIFFFIYFHFQIKLNIWIYSPETILIEFGWCAMDNVADTVFFYCKWNKLNWIKFWPKNCLWIFVESRNIYVSMSICNLNDMFDYTF